MKQPPTVCANKLEECYYDPSWGTEGQIICGSHEAFKASGGRPELEDHKAGPELRKGKVCMGLAKVFNVPRDHEMWNHELYVCRAPDGIRRKSGDYYGNFQIDRRYNRERDTYVPLTRTEHFGKIEC